MRGILRWIFFAILIIVILLILVNVANKSKSKPKTSAPPTVYEKSNINNNDTESDSEDGLVPISDNIELEQNVQVGDTASFSTVCVYIGMFILTFGAYYIRKKQIN